MSPDAFAKIAGGLQSIVTIFAILVGGGWALYTFVKLNAVKKARAELAELEQRMVEFPSLSIALAWQGWPERGAGKHTVAVSAALRNDGKRTLKLGDVRAFLLQRRETGAAGKPPPVRATIAEYLDQEAGLQTASVRYLRSGQARTVALVFPDVPAGDYLLQVNAGYAGALLRNGRLVASKDLTIEAVEQAIVHIAPPGASPRARARTRAGAKTR